MSLAAPYQEHYYIADGEMITFPFGDFFQALSQNYVKCVIYFSDGTSCIPTFTVDMENQQITIVTLTKPDGTVLTVPPAGSVVRVYRETPEQQNVTASQLQNYTAKQLEKIFDSMVAMQQETSYSDLHKNIRLTEPQRDISIEPLTEEKDQALLYWDEESRQIKSTEYGQDEVIEQIERANTVADEAKTIAGKARDDLRDHEMDKGNPHETSMAKLTDTEIVDPERFQFLSFDGTKWKNVNYSATYTWGGIGGNIADQTDLFDTFVKKTGDTVSGMYKHSYGSRTRYLSSNDTNKYMDVYMNGDIFTLYYHYTNSSTATLSMRSYVDGHFNIYPSSDKGGTIGFPSRRFEKIYTTHLCGSINGNNYLIVPDVGHSDTIATKSQVDLAANSGSQLYTTGVWYAKMYAATVVPTGAEYDGRNYADFSQVDSDNNPVIKIYTGASGAWTLTETITPPATYNGYMTITSKIWDIAEQSGQQGGQVLWDYTHKTFTPYPRIVSFESINITGNSTVIMPDNPTNNSIVNKEYVDTHTGTGNYHPDLFDWKWADHQLNDVQWLRADTFSWQDGGVYEAAYKHLCNDKYYWYKWNNENGTPVDIYTRKKYPVVGDDVYSSSTLTDANKIGTVTAVTSGVNNVQITFNNTSYSQVEGQVSVVSETIAGITITYNVTEDGHKITDAFSESEVTAIYTATGVAWYYILDETNQRFKLPRSKHNKYADTLSVIGNGNSLYMTNGTSSGYLSGKDSGTDNWVSGPRTDGSSTPSSSTSFYIGVLGGTYGVSTDPEKSGMVAQQTQDTDQYKYLYFYVGEFTQTALKNTAGLNAELFNDKVDLSGSWGFPSDTKTELTLGASGTTYTAPADGYVYFEGGATSGTKYGSIYNTNNSMGTSGVSVSGIANVRLYLPVKKGDIFRVSYSLDTSLSFRFIYAQKTN